MSKLISRSGSKTNDIKYFIDLLPKDVKIVVEPFGGSFAVIRDVYSDDKYIKYVNDNDPNLAYIYDNPEELIKGYEVWNKINDAEMTAKEKITKFMKTKMNKFLKEYILQSQVVRGTITNSKNLDNAINDIKFMNKINFTFGDAFKVIEKFRKNKNAFIFLDPPYLFSNNQTYYSQTVDTDNTDYYIKLINIFNDKLYQVSKKLSKHLIITNY